MDGIAICFKYPTVQGLGCYGIKAAVYRDNKGATFYGARNFFKVVATAY